MTHALTVARQNARTLLADAQVAIASGDWIVTATADPANDIDALEALLGLPASAEAIATATDALAACCGAAIAGGDWLSAANDRGPFDARRAVAAAKISEARGEVQGIDTDEVYDLIMRTAA